MKVIRTIIFKNMYFSNIHLAVIVPTGLNMEYYAVYSTLHGLHKFPHAKYIYEQPYVSSIWKRFMARNQSKSHVIINVFNKQLI